jgi:hypothetical protein
MTTRQVIEANEFVEDKELKRSKKWKEIRYIWNILQRKEYKNKGTVENALWFYGHTENMHIIPRYNSTVSNANSKSSHKGNEMRNNNSLTEKFQSLEIDHSFIISNKTKGSITVENFVMAMINEFQFDRSLHIDKHLRSLYWSFEGGRQNMVDSREIISSFKILTFYRLVQNRTIELLTSLFDIFAIGGSDNPNALPNEEWYIPNNLVDICPIFYLPLIKDTDFFLIQEKLNDALLSVTNNNNNNHTASSIESRNTLQSPSSRSATFLPAIEASRSSFTSPSPSRSTRKTSFDDSSYSSESSYSTEVYTVNSMNRTVITANESSRFERYDRLYNDPNIITRKKFRRMLKMSPDLVSMWKNCVWEQIPSELR